MKTHLTSSRLYSLRSLAVAGILAFAQVHALAADGHWVTTWGTAPQLTEPGNLPPVPLAHSTLRQFIRTSIGGRQLRVRFSNAYGTNSVTINTARIALAPATASGGDGDIHTATDKGLTFRGAPSTVIPPGEVVFSDTIAFDLPAITNVAISIHYGNISASTINGHPGSRSTSFIQSGNAISVASMPSASKTTHWYTITGLEVLADNSSKAIAILGDSITDGRGSTDNGNNRWPDILAERLAANGPTSGVGVINMGIGGNAIFGGLGPAAVNRFDRDILNQSGVRYFILFEGVNDIGSGSSSMTTATNLVNAYAQMATKAKARGLRAYGATITPFGGSGYYSALHEQERQFVNAWIRTNSIFDGVIDFDAVVRDPADPTKFKAEYYPGVNANDWLHLNTIGLKAMADSIDLNLFTQ
jgi:lysophospholipase L1-like esterase